MKVLHIGQMIGGLEVYIRNSIEQASGEIEYVIMHGKGDESKPVVCQGVTVKEYLTDLQRDLSVRHDAIALWQAVKIIRKEKPDVVHCHSAKGGIVGRVAGFLTHTPVLYTPHGYSFLCSPKKKTQWVYKMIERVTRLGAWMLACGESEQKLGKEEIGYSEKKALCWHNCVPQFVAPEAYKSEYRYVTIIGRPSYQKNPFLLLEVVKLVHERLPWLKFGLLGVGYYSPELEAMQAKIKEYGLEDTLLLEPWISHEEALARTAGALLYLTVSRYEGLPLAVVEAMSLGKAVVATDAVGNRDCVRDGENGRLLSLEDAGAIADAIVEIVTDDEMRGRMEKRSREIYEQEFMIEKRIGMLEEVYRRFE